MTAIDYTAYPRPGLRLPREEFSARYTLTETDLIFIRSGGPGEIGRLMLKNRMTRDYGKVAEPPFMGKCSSNRRSGG
jgi:hypothetical protein